MSLYSSFKFHYITLLYSFTNVSMSGFLKQVVQLKAVKNARKVTTVYWESAPHALTHWYFLMAIAMTVSCMHVLNR